MSRRVLGAGVGVLFAAALAAYGVTGLVRIRALRAEIAEAEREIAVLRDQQRKLVETIDLLRHDPAYLEKLAREEYGFVREGETVLKFPSRGK